MWDLGSTEEASAAIREALGLRRVLATERPAARNADLAESLSNRSLCQVLAADRLAAYNADLAVSLSNMSICLLDLSRQDEALTTRQEALSLNAI